MMRGGDQAGRRAGRKGIGRRMRGVMTTVFSVVFLFWYSAATAEEVMPKKIDLSAAVRYSYPFGHEGGTGRWSDLYDPAWGGALEVGYRVRPRFILHAGMAQDRYPGADFLLITTSGPRLGRFKDQKLLSVYFGGRGYLLGAAVPQKSGGIDPYVRIDLGATHFNGSSFDGIPTGGRSNEFFFSVGIGADLLTYSRFIFLFEVKYEDHGYPDPAGNSFRAVPILLGLRYLI